MDTTTPRPAVRWDPDGGYYFIIPKPHETHYMGIGATEGWPASWPERPETHNAYGFTEWDHALRAAYAFVQEVSK